MSIKNKIDFTKVSDPKLLVSSKIELNSDTAKGASNAATIIIPNVYHNPSLCFDISSLIVLYIYFTIIERNNNVRKVLYFWLMRNYNTNFIFLFQYCLLYTSPSPRDTR